MGNLHRVVETWERPLGHPTKNNSCLSPRESNTSLRMGEGDIREFSRFIKRKFLIWSSLCLHVLCSWTTTNSKVHFPVVSPWVEKLIPTSKALHSTNCEKLCLSIVMNGNLYLPIYFVCLVFTPRAGKIMALSHQANIRFSSVPCNSFSDIAHTGKMKSLLILCWKKLVTA